MKPFGLIYHVRNEKRGMSYIGATIQPLSRRWNKHVSVALRGGCDCPKLHPAIRDDGKEAFEVQVLAYAYSADELVELEEGYIRMFDTVERGYNVLYGRKKRC